MSATNETPAQRLQRLANERKAAGTLPSVPPTIARRTTVTPTARPVVKSIQSTVTSQTPTRQTVSNASSNSQIQARVAALNAQIRENSRKAPTTQQVRQARVIRRRGESFRSFQARQAAGQAKINSLQAQQARVAQANEALARQIIALNKGLISQGDLVKQREIADRAERDLQFQRTVVVDPNRSNDTAQNRAAKGFNAKLQEVRASISRARTGSASEAELKNLGNVSGVLNQAVKQSQQSKIGGAESRAAAAASGAAAERIASQEFAAPRKTGFTSDSFIEGESPAQRLQRLANAGKATNFEKATALRDSKTGVIQGINPLTGKKNLTVGVPISEEFNISGTVPAITRKGEGRILAEGNVPANVLKVFEGQQNFTRKLAESLARKRQAGLAQGLTANEANRQALKGAGVSKAELNAINSELQSDIIKENARKLEAAHALINKQNRGELKAGELNDLKGLLADETLVHNLSRPNAYKEVLVQTDEDGNDISERRTRLLVENALAAGAEPDALRFRIQDFEGNEKIKSAENVQLDAIGDSLGEPAVANGDVNIEALLGKVNRPILEKSLSGVSVQERVIRRNLGQLSDSTDVATLGQISTFEARSKATFNKDTTNDQINTLVPNALTLFEQQKEFALSQEVDDQGNQVFNVVVDGKLVQGFDNKIDLFTYLLDNGFLKIRGRDPNTGEYSFTIEDVKGFRDYLGSDITNENQGQNLLQIFGLLEGLLNRVNEQEATINNLKTERVEQNFAAPKSFLDSIIEFVETAAVSLSVGLASLTGDRR